MSSFDFSKDCSADLSTADEVIGYHRIIDSKFSQHRVHDTADFRTQQSLSRAFDSLVVPWRKTPGVVNLYLLRLAPSAFSFRFDLSHLLMISNRLNAALTQHPNVASRAKKLKASFNKESRVLSIDSLVPPLKRSSKRKFGTSLIFQT